MDFDAERKRWEETTLQPVLNKSPERKEQFTTPSGIELPRVSQPQDYDYMDKMCFP